MGDHRRPPPVRRHVPRRGRHRSRHPTQSSFSRPASPTSSSWPWRPWPTAPRTTSSRRRWPASRPTRPATPRSGTRCSARSSRTAAPSGPSTSSTRCGGGAGGCSSRSPAPPWNTSRRVEARTRSFKEFMEEWVIEQFTKNLAEFGLERPVVLGSVLGGAGLRPPQLPARLLRLPHDALVRRCHARHRGTPLAEREVSTVGRDLRAASGNGSRQEWDTNGEAGTLAYALPALCNLCQLPTLFVRPGKNTACTLESRAAATTSSAPNRAGGSSSSRRSASRDTCSVVDRIVAGEAPGKLIDLHDWMGLEAPTETGKDLRRGLDPGGSNRCRRPDAMATCRLPLRLPDRRLLRAGHRGRRPTSG